MINFKLTFRNLIKGGTQTVLNILGLAIGFACTFGIAVWIKNELSYDRQLPDASRIYRLTFETNTSGNRLHFARCNQKWISQLPLEYPQIEELVRLSPYRHTALKAGDNNKFYTDRIFASDSNFFRVFNINLITGNPDNILNEPYTAVISSSIAHKCFGETDPVGQIIFLSGEYDVKMIPFTVKGVMKDTPVNSHIHFDVVTSYVNPREAPDWAYVYLLLGKGTDPGQLLSALPGFIGKMEYTSPERTITPSLQKISNIHLYSNKDREVEPNGNITIVWLFAIIAFVILVVCLVNFYNLCKARILTLQKSIFMQRVLGSEYKHITLQAASESAIIILLAFIIALILLDLAGQIASAIPRLNLTGNNLEGLISLWPAVLAVIAVSLVTGILPLLMLILNRKLNFRSLEGTGEQNKLKSYGMLMTVQFTLSIILMIATIVISQQKKYIFSNSLGKMNPNMIVLKKQNWEVRLKYASIRDQAMATPYIKNFTASMEEPAGETVDAMQVESSGIDENHKNKQLYVLSVEDNFLDFFGIQLAAGRNFSKYNPDRKGEDYILNEAAVKELGWTPQEAIGKPFKIVFEVPDIFYGGNVVGVAKDFNITTAKQKIKPYVIFQKPIFYLCFIIELDPAHKNEAIESFKKIWEKELPDYPFEYEFISDLYNSVYRKELNEAKLTMLFSILIIFIICMGLFAITSVLIEKRTREIGIRKVNGARVAEILRMLNSEFLIWYIIAFIIACPVAWLLMTRWLQNFTYRTDLSWWMFVIPGFLVFGITFLTVTLRSWGAATRNPVEALRYE